MKLSIAVTDYSWPGGPEQLAGHLRTLARQVDEAGVDTLWVADHLLQMDPNASVDDPMLEAYTTLGYLAAATERVRLGTMVTWATIRPPMLLVKAVTTLDVLSGGRAWLGVGAGYRADEATMTGLPFPPTPERFDRVEELLQLADHTWRGDRSPFDGRFHRLTEPINEPPPIRRPRVLIGGTGETRTLPLVARYADACNLFDIPDGGATVRHKLAVLAEACAAVGRDVGEVEVTLSSRLAPGETTDQLADRCAELARIGIDHLVLVTNGPWHSGADLDTALAAVDPLRALS
ncbi:MAG TPA: TIGR03560 family F420-dependent LLM class oxidoreductase [Iamia sp.]|nr:TIGR03560 family F420-dependent LLM class oxidoreductase [Iamia sp.]